MIRCLEKSDLPIIDHIGSQIKEDFVKKNNIEDVFNSDYREVYVYVESDKVIGFIEIEKHFEIIDLVNISVDKDFQRKGIASLLINHIVINNKNCKILLEVRETNEKAINFYKKNNFLEINRRKKYYVDEDAIIMERSI